MMLRYPYEVRKENEYFDDIADEKIPKDMLELASHIVASKAGHFKPEMFEDQYEDALKELLKKKQSGEKIEAPRERVPSKVVNLMDALRRSVETERGGGERRKPAPRAGDHRAPKNGAVTQSPVQTVTLAPRASPLNLIDPESPRLHTSPEPRA